MELPQIGDWLIPLPKKKSPGGTAPGAHGPMLWSRLDQYRPTPGPPKR